MQTRLVVFKNSFVIHIIHKYTNIHFKDIDDENLYFVVYKIAQNGFVRSGVL